MHMSQRQIAIGRRFDEDTEGDQVVNLADVSGGLQFFQSFHIARVPLDLLVETVEVFDAPGYLRLDTEGVYLCTQNTADALDVRAPLLALQFDNGQHPVIFIRLNDLKCKILQLALDTRHTQASSQGSIDLTRLQGHSQHLLPVALVAGLAHNADRVQAIGELEEHDAGIFGHGDEHLTHGLGLLPAHCLANTGLLVLQRPARACFFALFVIFLRSTQLSYLAVSYSFSDVLLLALQNIEAGHAAHDARRRRTKHLLHALHGQHLRVDGLEYEAS